MEQACTTVLSRPAPSPPSLRVADCPYNAQMTIEAMRKAAQSDGCQLAVFPCLASPATPAAIFFAAAFAEGGGGCAG